MGKQGYLGAPLGGLNLGDGKRGIKMQRAEWSTV